MSDERENKLADVREAITFLAAIGKDDDQNIMQDSEEDYEEEPTEEEEDGNLKSGEVGQNFEETDDETVDWYLICRFKGSEFLVEISLEWSVNIYDDSATCLDFADFNRDMIEAMESAFESPDDVDTENAMDTRGHEFLKEGLGEGMFSIKVVFTPLWYKDALVYIKHALSAMIYSRNWMSDVEKSTAFCSYYGSDGEEVDTWRTLGAGRECKRYHVTFWINYHNRELDWDQMRVHGDLQGIYYTLIEDIGSNFQTVEDLIVSENSTEHTYTKHGILNNWSVKVELEEHAD